MVDDSVDAWVRAHHGCAQRGDVADDPVGAAGLRLQLGLTPDDAADLYSHVADRERVVAAEVEQLTAGGVERLNENIDDV